MQILEQQGIATICGDKNSFEITGPLISKVREIPVDCSETTQFASALMLALADTPIKIRPIRHHSSRPYLDMTEELIRSFPDHLSPYTVPPDFSCLGYPLALGMTCGRALITNCHAIDPHQADSVLIPMAREMNATVELTGQGLEARTKRELTPILRDCSDCPDLVPTLAFLASCARGTSRLGGLGVLRHKESDRIREILRLLKTFQVSHSFDHQKNELSIAGPTSVAPFLHYDPPDDHRIIMTAYLFMRRNAGGLISDTRHVRQVLSRFF